MTIGDKLLLTPSFYSEAGLEKVGLQEAVVTYIHPERRFFEVAFTAQSGQTWRETFYFENRRGNGERSK